MMKYLKYYITPVLAPVVIIGILLGLASLFRLQAIFVLFPILIFILLRNKKTIKNTLNLLTILIFFSLVFSPQILYNFSTHGVILDSGINPN